MLSGAIKNEKCENRFLDISIIMNKKDQEAKISNIFGSLKFPRKAEPLTIDGIYSVPFQMKRSTEVIIGSMEVKPCYDTVCSDSFENFKYSNPQSTTNPYDEGNHFIVRAIGCPA